MALAVGLAIGFALPLPEPGSASASAPAHAIATRWSTPIASGPYAIASDGEGSIVTTNLGAVVALDRTGHRVWQLTITTNPPAPAIDGDAVVLGGDGRLWGVERSTGSERWTRAFDDQAERVVAAGGTAVVKGLEGDVEVLDTATGTTRWRFDGPGAVQGEPVVDASTGSVLLVARAEVGPVLHVFDAVTGAQRWERQLDWFVATPVVSEGRVFVAEGDGHFHAVVIAVDLESGERRWASQVRASFEPGIVPAADDRVLVVIDHYGHLTALDPADGAYRWERDLDETVLDTRVVLTERRLTVSTAAKDVAVLDRFTGRVVSRRSALQVDGWAVDLRAAAFAGRDHVVAAIRLGVHPRVEVWRVA
ncbi:MAG TPA: PQQ-binding-like beta-propeller repeat protein [Acidimicrobiia bacterium]|nr:PQQ-binding-like beta-propeller repeat protein [Acidimicrobiia bacterium]